MTGLPLHPLLYGSICLALVISQAFSHTNWVSPPHRAEENIKVAPCGGVPAGEPVDTLQAGDTVTVIWEEYINHPGFFTINFSTGDEDQFEEVVVVQDSQSTGENSYEFVVPDEECESCILQVIQTMTDRNPPTFYYSCADIQITPAPVAVETPFEEPSTFRLTPRGLEWQMPEIQGSTIRLEDASGRLVQVIALPNGADSGPHFSLFEKPLGPGIYYLRVRTGKRQMTRVLALP